MAHLPPDTFYTNIFFFFIDYLLFFGVVSPIYMTIMWTYVDPPPFFTIKKKICITDGVFNWINLRQNNSEKGFHLSGIRTHEPMHMGT